jgi:hypothetical protein
MIRGIFLIASLFLAVFSSQAQPDSKMFTQIQERIVRYMECIECQSEELKAVTDLNESVVPYLKEILLRGPAGARKEAYRQKLKRDYAQIKRYNERKNQAPAMQEETYVDYYMSNYDIIYRIRAVIALSQISSQGKSIIDSLLNSNSTNPKIKYAIEKGLH